MKWKTFKMYQKKIIKKQSEDQEIVSTLKYLPN